MSTQIPPNEVLLRQVHPASWHPTIPTKIDSSAFTPRSGEDGRTSYLRGRVPPEEAWRRYTKLGRGSAGTFGVSVQEADNCGCPSGDDSNEPDKPEDHAYIEVTGATNGEVRRKARKLASYATERGALYLPAE